MADSNVILKCVVYSFDINQCVNVKEKYSNGLVLWNKFDNYDQMKAYYDNLGFSYVYNAIDYIWRY